MIIPLDFIIALNFMIAGACLYTYFWNKALTDVWDSKQWWTAEEWKIILREGNSYGFFKDGKRIKKWEESK